jgi:hypothetical protein
MRNLIFFFFLSTKQQTTNTNKVDNHNEASTMEGRRTVSIYPHYCSSVLLLIVIDADPGRPLNGSEPANPTWVTADCELGTHLSHKNEL